MFKYITTLMLATLLLAASASANVPIDEYWTVIGAQDEVSNSLVFYVDSLPTSATAALDLQLGLAEKTAITPIVRDINDLQSSSGIIVTQTIPDALNEQCTQKLQKARQFVGYCKINGNNYLLVYGATPKDIANVAELVKYDNIEDAEYFVHANVSYQEVEQTETVADKFVGWVITFFE